MSLTPLPLSLEERIAAIERYLTSQNVAWNMPPLVVPVGSTGSMTLTPPLSPVGYVTPLAAVGARVRNARIVMEDTYRYTLAYGQTRRVLGKQRDGGYLWYALEDGNYVREDAVTFSEDAPVIAPPSGKWPAPIAGYRVTNTHHNERNHEGVDLAAPIGTPIVASDEGVAVKVFHCLTCHPEGDGAASLHDKTKAYGYGTHVIVRYDHHSLPLPTRLALNGFVHVFVMFAHLQLAIVKQGQKLTASQEIGRVGSTGNSSGPHVHIECRYSSDPKADWYSIRGNAVDPETVFDI